MSVLASFAREAQALLADLADAVDTTATGAQARPWLSIEETLEAFGGRESFDG